MGSPSRRCILPACASLRRSSHNIWRRRRKRCTRLVLRRPRRSRWDCAASTRGRPDPGNVNNAGSALPVSRRGPEREQVVAELGGLLTIAARWRHSRRTLVETTVLAGERGQYRLMQPAQAIQLPATIQVMLAARIDRLAQED